MKIFLFLCIVFITSCQKPVAQAPVYNYNFTDNSQFIVGEGNVAQSIPKTDNIQKTESSASAESKKQNSNWWIFGLILIALTAGIAYYGWRKGWIKI